MSLVLGLGLEHSCPWPRKGLSSEGLSLALASDFFVSLAFASSFVSSTPPLVRTVQYVELRCEGAFSELYMAVNLAGVMKFCL